MLTAKHHRAIGSAIWVWLWLLDRQTGTDGVVLGGAPVRMTRIGADLGVSERTVRTCLLRLQRQRYIDTRRAPRGLVLVVLAQKKYPSGSEEKIRSEPQRSEENAGVIGRKLPAGSEESFRCNKTPENRHLKTDIHPPPTGGNGRMPGESGEVLRAFDTGHRAAFGGTPYLAAFARDLKVLRDPLKLYGLARMLEFIGAFWDEVCKARGHPDDPKYAAGRAKPNIPGFIGQIPNLLRRYAFDSPLPEARPKETAP